MHNYIDFGFRICDFGFVIADVATFITLGKKT